MVADEPRTSPRRQSRARRTRQELVRAAERLWRDQGFDTTTVSEICAEAGVAKGTFYFYFPRKEDLLLELGLSTSDRVRDESTAAEALDLPLADALHRAVDGLAKRAGRTPPELLERTIVELHRRLAEWPGFVGDHTDLFGVFHAIFGHARERGPLPPGLDPAEAASLVATGMLNGMLRWSRGSYGRVGLSEVLGNRLDLILYGLLERPSGEGPPQSRRVRDSTAEHAPARPPGNRDEADRSAVPQEDR